MIDRHLLNATVADALAGTDLFIVSVDVRPGNEIIVEIDSPSGVDIDSCADITRKIEAVFDRDVEDYDLEVGSAGITSDFKVRGQYEKNIGNEVEILTRDGRKLHGVLTEVAGGAVTDTDVDFTVEIPTKVKEPGAKRPTVVNEPVKMSSAACKYIRYDLKF